MMLHPQMGETSQPQGGFSPQLSKPLSPGTHMLGVPDVTDQEMVDYAHRVPGALQGGQLASDPALATQVLIHARLDKEWIQVAKEYKVLTGDKRKDKLIWEEHQAYMQGAAGDELDSDGMPIPVSDPLETDSDAMDEYLKRAMKVVGGE